MLNETVTTMPVKPFKRLSWTAILAGALVGIGLSFLLGLLGAAMGLSIFNMGANGVLTLAVGGLIGIVICIIISMLAAGYTAGYLGRLYCPRRNLGILYGFTAWTVALILSALLTTYMSSYVTASSPQISTGSQVLLSPQATSTPAKTNATSKEDDANTTATTSSPLTMQTSALQANGNQIITVQASPNALAWGAFVIFALFLIGAFFSCLGACWGMGCKKED